MNRSEILNVFNGAPAIIAGPCSIESGRQVMQLAGELSALGIRFLRGGAFKPRTSPDAFQGLGSEAIDYIRKAADRHDMYVVSEILDQDQLDQCYDKIDVIQIGSRNMASYGLLKIIGKKTAAGQKPVLLKRGFSATIGELLGAADYIRQKGNPNVWLCLRGIRTFEQIDSIFRFTPDLGSIVEIKQRSDLPVLYDPSHSTGDSKFVIPIAKAALQLGADGLLIETHNNPEKALTDGKQSVLPSALSALLDRDF